MNYEEYNDCATTHFALEHAVMVARDIAARGHCSPVDAAVAVVDAYVAAAKRLNEAIAQQPAQA